MEIDLNSDFWNQSPTCSLLHYRTSNTSCGKLIIIMMNSWIYSNNYYLFETSVLDYVITNCASNHHWSYSVMVSTLDSESKNPSSNLGRTFGLFLHFTCNFYDI